MSLGRLLASGRSLAGGPLVGRYNVNEANRLPKFNAAKNPFATPVAKPAPEVTPTVQPVPPATPIAEAPASPANSPFAAADLKQTQRIPVLPRPALWDRVSNAKAELMKLAKAVLPFALAAASKLLALAGNLLSRAKRMRRKKEPQSVIPRFGKPAVQGELSLDNVKVIRNDLEESDLEIVTAQTGTSTQVAPTVAPATPNRGPVPPALKKLTNRMLGVKLS
jgi:hypothetical protein